MDRHIIGLDIGSSSVKLAQLARREDGIHLTRAESEEITPALHQGGTGPALHQGGTWPAADDASWEEEALSALKKLLRGVDTRRAEFAVVINCSLTSLKRITMPYMPMSELREGIWLAAKKYFPDAQSAMLDFQILGEAAEGGIKKYDILVAASPSATVDRYLSLLYELNIKPSSFVPPAYALAVVLREVSPEKGLVYALLEMGKRYGELSFFEGKNFLFSRKIPLSGDDFTKALVDVLSSDRGRVELMPEEAERIKRQVGVPFPCGQKVSPLRAEGVPLAGRDVPTGEPESGNPELIEGKVSSSQIMAMLGSPLQMLANEIGLSLDYFRENTGVEKIDSLALSGGGASLKNLPAFLYEKLGVQTTHGFPLGWLKIEPDLKGRERELSQRFLPAIGAALSQPTGINLLPSELKQQLKRTVRRTTLESAVVTVLFILAFLYIGMRIQLVNFQKRIAVAERELSSLQPLLEEFRERCIICDILSDEPWWEDVFKELSNVLPRKMYLTELKMGNKIIAMKGFVLSKEGQELLSNFMLALEKGIFKDVRLVTTRELKEKGGSEFELECRVD